MLGLGLVTSFHCVAMCGALVVTYAINDGAPGSFGQRLTPHLVYQSAKIASYVAVGTVLGLVGAAFDLAGIRGWVMLAAGLFMVGLGLNMTGRFPLLRRITLKPPKALTQAISRNRKRARNEADAGHMTLATPLIFGLLTGLMPCGPLQAAQLTAASAGSAADGAVAMLGFGLGTAPLMLAFGIGSGYLGEVFKKRMNLVAAVVIIVLGLVMFNRGSMLVGSPITYQSARQVLSGPTVAGDDVEYRVGSDGAVEIDLAIVSTQFVPSTVQIPADTPVRLVVDRQEENTCSDQLAVPQLGILVDLAPNATTQVELPAVAEGTYSLTCGMGMMSGLIVSGAGGGSAGSPMLGLALGGLLLGIGAYALTRKVDSSSATCPAGKQLEPEDDVKRILGFTPAEIVVVGGVIAAAVLAGIVLAGALGS